MQKRNFSEWMLDFFGTVAAIVTIAVAVVVIGVVWIASLFPRKI